MISSDIFKPSLRYHQNQLKQLLVFKKSYLFKAFNMYSCAYCEYSTSYLQNLKRHEKNKHDKSKHALSQTGSGADVPMEQTAPSHFHNEKHSNLQEESIDQYENIDQLQKAYDTLKEQYQHVEKVTTCNDGRPSHVSIQLYDKCCNALKAYMFQCKRLRTQKEQQLDRFCTAWEDLKWERDAFVKEINRRDCCGEGYLDKKMAKKVRSGKYWGS